MAGDREKITEQENGAERRLDDIVSALKQESAVFESLVTSSPVGLYIVQNSRFCYVNPRFAEITGYCAEELIGAESLSFVHPEDRAMVREKAVANLKNDFRRFYPYEYRLLNKTGEYRWMLETVTSTIYQGKRAALGNSMDITGRKQAETQLALTADLLDSATDAIFACDMEGKIIYVNKSTCVLHGYTREELLGMNIHDIDIPESSAIIQREIIEKGQATFETTHRHKNGSLIPVEVRSRVTEWGGQKLGVSVARDITHRREVQERIRANEERYRAIFNEARDGIVLIDPATGFIVDCNPEFERLTGRPFGELQKLTLWDIRPPELRQTTKQIFANAGASGQSQGESTTMPFQKPDGTIVPIELKAKKTVLAGKDYIQGIVRDITERRRDEAKIKQAQEELSAINKHLEERNRQNSIMGEMRELLQSCSTIQEMPSIVKISISRMFPGTDGALFLLNNSRSDLQSVLRWGDFPDSVDDNIFPPDSCWGLRRGRVHLVEDIDVGPNCLHLKHSSPAVYMCLPLIAKGDLLGLLHLQMKTVAPENKQKTIAELRETAANFAEYLSLSIANIKLWEKLADQSIRDPLTGLFNRRFMEETIQREILRAERKQAKIGIIMADLDYFKKFNDIYGHKAGDELLVKLADLFRNKIRGSDIACRYGGEEFILILAESSTDDTLKRAEYLRQEVKNMKVYFRDQLLPSVTISMGIAMYPDHGKEVDGLIRIADTALYKAKEAGRDRVVSG